MSHQLYYGLTLRTPTFGDVLLPMGTGYVDTFVPLQLFETDEAAAINIVQTTGFVDAFVPLQSFAADGAAIAISQATGFVDAFVLRQTFQADEATAISLPQTTGFLDVKTVEQLFETDQAAAIQLGQATGFIDIKVLQQSFETDEAAAISLPQVAGFVDIKVVEQVFQTDEAAAIALPQATGFVDSAVIVQAFSADTPQPISLAQSTGFVDAAVISQSFQNDEAAAISLTQTTGFVDIKVLQQLFQSDSATAIQLVQTTGFVDSTVISQSFQNDEAAAISLTLTTGFVDSAVISQLFTTDTTSAIAFPQTTGFVDVTVIKQTISEDVEATGPAGHFNGNAYLERAVTGFRTADTIGAVSMWFKTSFESDEFMTLFTGNDGPTPRLELGVETGEGNSIYIEVDDGIIVTNWTIDAPINLSDNQLHNIIFSSDGEEWKVWLDGTPVPDTNPTNNIGKWFQPLQAGAAGVFTRVAIGAFVDVIPTQYYTGVIDDSFVMDSQPTNEMASWLYNTQAKIPQIQSQRTDIWGDVVLAWELENDATKDLGDEYVTPVADYFTIVNTTPAGEGIRGILQVAADMDDATSTGLRAPDHSSMDHAGVVTLTCWVRFDDASPSAIQQVVAKTDVQAEYELFRDASTNKLVFRIFDTATKSAVATGTVATDRWYYVACRTNPVQITIGDSVGTALSHSTTTTDTGVRLTASNIEFGMGGGIRHLDGGIDDVKLFHQRLSDTELTYDYNLGKGRTIAVIEDDNPMLFAKVVSHWNFNENSGIRVDDVGVNDAVVPTGKTDPGTRVGHIVD